jgi:secreted PhoX family phosphatase
MRQNEQIEKWFAELKAKPGQQLDARVHRAIDEALAERKQTPSAGYFLPKIWRMIMKKRITRWTAAGLTAAALAASILVLEKTTPSAFGLDQVIAAAKGVRTLHIKTQGPKELAPKEFWLVCDQSGHVAKARYYLPVTQDGAKLITWTPERTEIWFQTKHGFLMLQTTNVEAWMQRLLEQSQPQLVTAKLKEDETIGKVEMDVQQPADQAQPVKIVVVNKTKPLKQVYWIDQKSDLITSIEQYGTDGGADVLQSKTEFLDYNVPIDDKMFSLRDQCRRMSGLPIKSRR